MKNFFDLAKYAHTGIASPGMTYYDKMRALAAFGVNEPLAKIGDYADELHSTDAAVTIPTTKGQNVLTVETELQPSEMTITYKG